MKVFKIKDRVAAYTFQGRQTGKVSLIYPDGTIDIELDKLHNGNEVMSAHPKQCRRLLKKEPRKIYVNPALVQNAPLDSQTLEVIKLAMKNNVVLVAESSNKTRIEQFGKEWPVFVEVKR